MPNPYTTEQIKGELLLAECLAENGGPHFPSNFAPAADQMLLVTREVAEAAAHVKHTCDLDEMCCSENCKPHPLAERMVWADNKTLDFPDGQLIGYRSLRRAPRKGDQ